MVKSRERRGVRVCEGSVEEGVYKAIEVTTNITGVLCAKKRWKNEDGARLLVFKQLDSQEKLSTTTDFRSDKQY